MATTYYVETYSHTRAYIPDSRYAVESRDAGFKELGRLADQFQCAILTSDNPEDSIVIQRNHPNPYVSWKSERDAASAFDLKQSNWREIWSGQA